MRRSMCLLVALLLAGNSGLAFAQSKTPPSKKVPNGVYAVLREGPKEAALRPLKGGEAIVVDHHRYLKGDAHEPPQFLVVHSTPDVRLDLVGKPKAEKQDGEVVRILLKLQPKAAAALEHLTTARLGKTVAIVLKGEVVTEHKVRQAIKGGEVQITSCTPGGAAYLLKQLQAH